MERKELVIRIIRQDLHHSQLLWGLRKLGFDSEDKYFLSFVDIIADLMEIRDDEKEAFSRKYYEFLYQVEQCPFLELPGRDWGVLAAECYKQLKG